MSIDAPPTLLNTIMHNKHLNHLMAKSMNELAHKSPLIYPGFRSLFKKDLVATASAKCFKCL